MDVRSIFGSGTRSQGLATSRPASTAMRMIFAMICAAFTTVAGARPCWESAATQRRTFMWSMADSGSAPNVGSR
jgi:hypothetical protein